MEATVLNPIQMHLLKMFQYEKDETNLKEIQQILFEYYCNKVEEEAERIWDEKGFTNELMNEWKNTHMRTPYKL